jgi:hypothetical protein
VWEEAGLQAGYYILEIILLGISTRWVGGCVILIVI